MTNLKTEQEFINELERMQDEYYVLRDDARSARNSYEYYKDQADSLQDIIEKRFKSMYKLYPDTEYELDI